jgi:hypothetical protein
LAAIIQTKKKSTVFLFLDQMTGHSDDFQWGSASKPPPSGYISATQALWREHEFHCNQYTFDKPGSPGFRNKKQIKQKKSKQKKDGRTKLHWHPPVLLVAE